MNTWSLCVVLLLKIELHFQINKDLRSQAQADPLEQDVDMFLSPSFSLRVSPPSLSLALLSSPVLLNNKIFFCFCFFTNAIVFQYQILI